MMKMTPDTIRNKDIRLICLDLDGTLLNSSKQLSPRNRRALDEAAARGICIVPATGRLPMGLTQEVRTLPYLRYVISINGALTYDLAENRVLSRFEIPLAGALEILDVLKDYDGIYDCYRDGQGYMNAQMLAAADEFCADTHQLELVRATRVPVPDLAAFLRGAGSGPAAPNTANASADGVPASSGSVQKCQIMFRSRAARDAVLDEITGRLPGYLCTCS